MIFVFKNYYDRNGNFDLIVLLKSERLNFLNIVSWEFDVRMFFFIL